MEQPAYLEFMLNAVKNNQNLSFEEVNTYEFKKLNPFHKEMLWEKAVEACSIHYEDIFSKLNGKNNLKKALESLLKNPEVPLGFYDHIFTKYPNLFITVHQEKILDYPVSHFPLLFSKSLFSSQKMSFCICKLFEEPEKNLEKIEFIMENQKKRYLPFHNDMYYLVLFLAYMKENSEDQRRYICTDTRKYMFKPLVITDELTLTADIISRNFENIFEFIKPNIIKNVYRGQNFTRTIVNEQDFTYFISYVASVFNKNTLDKKLPRSLNSEKPKLVKI